MFGGVVRNFFIVGTWTKLASESNSLNRSILNDNAYIYVTNMTQQNIMKLWWEVLLLTGWLSAGYQFHSMQHFLFGQGFQQFECNKVKYPLIIIVSILMLVQQFPTFVTKSVINMNSDDIVSHYIWTPFSYNSLKVCSQIAGA